MGSAEIWNLYKELLDLTDARATAVKAYPVQWACASAAIAHIRAAAEIHVSLYEDENAGK